MKTTTKLPVHINNLTAICSSLIFLLLSVFFGSCSKDDFNPDLEHSPWEPELAFPLAYSEISFADLVRVNDSNTIIIVDSNQFCTLIYQSKVFEFKAHQLVVVPDQSHQNQFYLNNSQILTLNNSGSVQLTQSQDIVFSVSQGLEIDSLVFKNSQLEFEIITDFPCNAELQLSIPGMIKDGIVFEKTIPITYTGSSPTISIVSVPLHNYHMDLTKNGTANNTLEVNYKILITGNGAVASTSNSIECNLSLESLQYQILYGYVGQQNIGNIPDTVELSIFNNAVGIGNFTIAQPLIRFDISNSIGIPFAARISQLTALNSNQTNFTVASGIPDPIPVNSPSLNQVGQTLESSFTLNNRNSNVNALIAQQPKYCIVQSRIETNPAGNTINFITDSSKLSMNIHVELPLFGTAANFQINDTLPFNYSDLENVENLMLRMHIENWFPLEAAIQLIFADSNYLPLDTLFLPGEVVVPSGIITGNSERVNIAGIKLCDHQLNSNRISKITNAKNILIHAKASTFQQGNTNVKLFNDYKLKIKIGAIAKMKIQ